MAAAKKKTKSIFFLRKLFNTFVAVDKATAEAMEGMAANEENYFELRQVSKEDRRTAAQNRLMWTWYTDMSKTDSNEWAGKTKDEWHLEMKKMFLVPIFERDSESYALTMVMLRNLYRKGMREESTVLHKEIARLTSTTDASVAQFTEYLNVINRFCGMNGIRLRTDPKLWDLAMNENYQGDY